MTRLQPGRLVDQLAVYLPATVETREAMGDLQVENLLLHFAGKPVRTPV